MSAAVPRYRSETSLGLPSTQPISRRYQYGFPLITFLYRLATTLGHRPFRAGKQAGTPCYRRSAPTEALRSPFKINLARKLGLGRDPLASTDRGAPGWTEGGPVLDKWAERV